MKPLIGTCSSIGGVATTRAAYCISKGNILVPRIGRVHAKRQGRDIWYEISHPAPHTVPALGNIWTDSVVLAIQTK